MKVMGRGLLALAFVILESALVPIALEIGGVAIGVLPLLFYTSLVATVTMAIFSYFEDRWKGFRSILKTRSTLIPVAVAGFLGFGVTQLLQNIGTIGTNPSVSAVVWRSWVVMLAVLTPLLLRQRVTRRQYASILLGIISVYIIASSGTVLSLNMQQLPFIVTLLASGLAVALSTLIAKRYTVSTSGFVLVASISTLIFSAPFAWQTVGAGLPENAVLAILFLGVIDTGIGSVLYYHSFKTFNTAFVGSALLSIPFITIALSYLLIGTPVLWYYIPAAILLGAAIFIGREEAARAPVRVASRSAIGNLTMFDITSAFVNNKDPAIYGAVQGRGRALAMKLAGGNFDASKHAKIFEDRGCFAFTAASPHAAVAPDEMEFVKDIMGLGQQEDALIGIGDPESVEDAFGEFVLNVERDRMTKSEQ